MGSGDFEGSLLKFKKLQRLSNVFQGSIEEISIEFHTVSRQLNRFKKIAEHFVGLHDGLRGTAYVENP